MEIYLIRHTSPLIEKGICYGQTDLDVTETFLSEASEIKAYLPSSIQQVYSSPLQRCAKLAIELFPQINIEWQNDLMELHCGSWEMQYWDDIPKQEIQPWLADYIHTIVPGGESYLQLYQRVINRFETICTNEQSIAIVAHGGVLRSILAHIAAIPLKDAFSVFQLHYGAVVKIIVGTNQYSYELLHNIVPVVKEQHRPSFT
jgi:alpha-ribazole phosphatase